MPALVADEPEGQHYVGNSQEVLLAKGEDTEGLDWLYTPLNNDKQGVQSHQMMFRVALVVIIVAKAAPVPDVVGQPQEAAMLGDKVGEASDDAPVPGDDPGTSTKQQDAAEDPPEAVEKVDTATTGSNVPHDIQVRVSVALFTPDEASNNLEVDHAAHHEDEAQGARGGVPPVLRRDVHAQPRHQEELGVLLADGYGHHLLGVVPAEVVLGQTVQQFVTVSKQEEVQDEDNQVLQITVLYVHGGCIKLRQVLDTAINFLHDDGVFVVAVLHHDASENHLHHSCHTQASGQFLKINPINFVKFEYKTDKFTSGCKLHSLPVFCSTTRVAVKVAVIVSNKRAASDTTKELGSIVHRQISGEPATRMVIYSHKVKDISSVPGLLSVTKRSPRRRDVRLDAGGAMVRLQGRGGPCLQYGDGQLRPNEVAEEVKHVRLVRGVQPQDPGHQPMGLVVPHEGNDEDPARGGCPHNAEVQSLPSQVLAQVICCPKVNQVHACHNCREDQDEVHYHRQDQAQLRQQDHQHYPGDAGHSLAQCGDMEITFNTIKKVPAILKGNKLPCGTLIQPAGEHELGEDIEEIIRETEEDSEDTDGGIDITLSTSNTVNSHNPDSEDRLVFKQSVEDSTQVWEEDNMRVVSVHRPTQLVHDDAELQPGLVHVGNQLHYLPVADLRHLQHGQQVPEGVHVDWAHTLDVLDIINGVQPRGELEDLPPDGHEHEHQLPDAIPAQHVAVIRKGEVGGNSDEEVQRILSEVLAIPLQLTGFLVHRNLIQQVFIPAIVCLHGLESLHDGGDNLPPGDRDEPHHQGGGAGQDQAQLLPGHTRCGIPDLNTNSQASQFPYLKIINNLVNYPEDGSKMKRAVTKALLTYTGGDMVAFSVIMLTMSTPSWVMVILNTGFSTYMRSRRITCMGPGHGIALDGGCHRLHCSQILKASLKDSLGHYHDAIMSEVMPGISVVESLPEFCGHAINADMQYDVVKGLDDRVQSLQIQPRHECAVQVQGLHVRHYRGEDQDEVLHPRPDQWGTHGGLHDLVENTEDTMETVGTVVVSSSLISTQVEAGGPGHVVMEGTECVNLSVEIYQEQAGNHLQVLQGVLNLQKRGHRNYKEELLHCHDLHSQHLLLQHVHERRWDLQIVAAAQEIVVQLVAGKEDLGGLLGEHVHVDRGQPDEDVVSVQQLAVDVQYDETSITLLHNLLTNMLRMLVEMGVVHNDEQKLVQKTLHSLAHRQGLGLEHHQESHGHGHHHGPVPCHGQVVLCGQKDSVGLVDEEMVVQASCMPTLVVEELGHGLNQLVDEEKVDPEQELHGHDLQSKGSLLHHNSPQFPSTEGQKMEDQLQRFLLSKLRDFFTHSSEISDTGSAGRFNFVSENGINTYYFESDPDTMMMGIKLGGNVYRGHTAFSVTTHIFDEMSIVKG